MAANSFVAAKKERPVSPIVMGQNHRPSNICPELIDVELIYSGDWILGVQSAIAEKFPGCPMELVGAGFGDDVYDTPKHATELSFVVMRIDFKFLDVVDDRWHGIRAGKALLIVQPIKEKEIAPIRLPIN